MTEREIAEYLGLPGDTRIRPEIIASMASTKVPETGIEHIQAFRDFLKSGVRPARAARNAKT